MYTELETLRDALGGIECVKSSKIGIENGIGAGDYPLVRVVPVRATPGKPYNMRTIELGVYFGWDTTDAEGLELVYENLLALEEEVIQIIKSSGGRYIDTVTDEDRLPTYKVMVIRCEIQAERPES